MSGPAGGAGARRSQRATPKVQRWLDLLAALLARRGALTFDELAERVPAYGDPARDPDSRRRMFERDKEELRAFGVPLVTVEADGDRDAAYRLRREDFYLPYLALAAEHAPGRAPAPRRVDRYGYRALARLAFEPDELAAVADAAARARALGDPALAAHAERAVRKLAFDLPLDAAAPGDAHLAAAGARADPAVLDALGDALLARRRVTFAYHALARDAVGRRTVEPWGLFYLGGHWYLAGCDRARGDRAAGLRNFRVSRVRDVEAAGGAPGQYDVPADFRLGAHARSRQAWELGDGDAVEAVVAFGGDTGVTHGALTLGEPVPPGDAGPSGGGGTAYRRFRVRRPDAFVRWLLAFGGEARPVAPASLVAAYRAELDAVRALYAGDAGRAGALGEAP